MTEQMGPGYELTFIGTCEKSWTRSDLRNALRARIRGCGLKAEAQARFVHLRHAHCVASDQTEQHCDGDRTDGALSRLVAHPPAEPIG